MLRGVHWVALGVVPVAATGIAWAIHAGHYRPAKSTLEDLALAVCGAAVVLLLVRWQLERGPWFLWATALMANLGFREIHIEWADDFVYVGLLVLLWLALRHFDAFRSRLLHRGLLTGLAVGFATYALSVAVDQRWARGLPGEAVWQMQLEETLELIGHLVVGGTLLSSPRAVARGGSPAS